MTPDPTWLELLEKGGLGAALAFVLWAGWSFLMKLVEHKKASEDARSDLNKASEDAQNAINKANDEARTVLVNKLTDALIDVAKEKKE